MWALLLYLGFDYWWFIHHWVLPCSWPTGSHNPIHVLYAHLKIFQSWQAYQIYLRTQLRLKLISEGLEYWAVTASLWWEWGGAAAEVSSLCCQEEAQRLGGGGGTRERSRTRRDRRYNSSDSPGGGVRRRRKKRRGEETASVAAREDALAGGRARCMGCGLPCAPWPRDRCASWIESSQWRIHRMWKASKNTIRIHGNYAIR